MVMDEDSKSATSDSDSDYFPDTKSRARKRSKATGIKKPKRKLGSNQCASSTTDVLLLEHLPLEVLVMIFQYIVQQYGPFLALKKYGLVSKRWRLALLENKLWERVALPGKELWLKVNQALKWLCKFKCCAVKQLSISSWGTCHTNTNIELLSQLCHRVKCIEFNSCATHKFDEVFKCLGQVEKVTIVRCNVKSFDVLVQTSKDTLRYLSLTEVGGSLCHSLSKCDTPLVELNTLVLDNFWHVRADSISVLQKMCPNLIHLQLSFDYTVPRGIHTEFIPNRFLRLKFLELTFGYSSYASDHLPLFLASSPNLQSLVLVHYMQPGTVDYDKLVSLMPFNLRELEFFYCKFDFNELLTKLMLHCHALRRLTIASRRVGDDVIATIVSSPCASTLQYLDISGTDVTVDGIKMLLNSLCNLKHLDLMRCRYLPRGTRCLYNNATDLDKLSKISSSS